jgi:hypothetical protein
MRISHRLLFGGVLMGGNLPLPERLGQVIKINARLIDNCLKVIDYLHTAKDLERSINHIVQGTGLSYVQIRNCIKTHFPQCFEQDGFGGWKFTGEALSIHPPVVWTAKPVEIPDRPVNNGGWTWRNEYILALTQLFGKPLSEVLKEAQLAGKLQDLSGIGKTLARAADQMNKTGKVPF